MRVLAIDPGPRKSAYCFVENGWPHAGDICGNEELKWRNASEDQSAVTLVIERMACFGMPVGQEVFDTVFNYGRLVESWESRGGSWAFLTRGEVKMHICKSMRAKDANIRQALLDRFGGKEKAIGKKKNPGPLYGFRADMWSALAIGLTYCDICSSQKITTTALDNLSRR